MKIVCISDTHNQLGSMVNPIPDGDVLIHAGDLTNRGTFQEVARELCLLGKLPHKYKILIAGNHDFFFEQQRSYAETLCWENNIYYLENSEVEIEGLKFWGSPATPEFCNWAFNYDPNIELQEIFGRIPSDTNVLITHGPPRFHLERSVYGEDLGSYALHNKIVSDLHDLKLHVFGHIHFSHGQETSLSGITYVNASVCGEDYKPTNKPIVIDL